MKNYKRISLLLVLVLITIICIGCDSSDNGQDIDEKEINGTNINEEAKNNEEGEDLDSEEISVEEQVLFEEDGIKITLKSLEWEGIFGPSLKVQVENNSNESITVQSRDSSINGVMVDTMFSCDVVKGKKANDNITFSNSKLELAEIEKIKDIEFRFHIAESDTWDEILDTEIISISTSVDESYTQSYDDSGYEALDKDGYKIVMKKLDSGDSFWGADIYVYIENNSEKDITVQARDVSINGIMVNPIFSSEVLKGKKAYDTITFFESDLEDNDIESIETMELKFHIFDSKGWDSIYDSTEIEVVFK